MQGRWIKIFWKYSKFSSRELNCGCKGFDDETIDQELLSDIINNIRSNEIPSNLGKVTHLQLKNCQKLNILLDHQTLDQNIYQLDQISFVRVPQVNIEFR